MAITDVIGNRRPGPDTIGVEAGEANVRPRDLQRTFQLLLATVWLLDAVLQLQPFMFTRGANGFSGMINGLASGNPGWVARSITWNGSIIYHQPILTDTAFALIQFLIAFGITWRRTVKPALALSIVWSLGVWWFGEGAGQVFQGGATPFGGGPGGVLFYAVLAVLLWPSEGSDLPFVAARTVGAAVARWIWVAVWGVLAVHWSGRAAHPRRCTTWWRGWTAGSPDGWAMWIGSPRPSSSTTARRRRSCSPSCAQWWPRGSSCPPSTGR